ncbi:hypothetical protein RCL1_009022 [Eukaryota sp. TZLM3-RCL]
MLDYLREIPKLISIIIGVSVIGSYIVFFFIGRKTNRAKARSFALSIDDLCRRSFAQVGVNDQALLFQDSPSMFVHYATGRRNISSQTTELTLAPRQCLLSSLIGIISPQKDSFASQLVIENVVKSPLSFAIVRRPFEKQFREKFPFFTNLASSFYKSNQSLPSDYVVLCDISTPVNSILTSSDFLTQLSELPTLQYVLYLDFDLFSGRKFTANSKGNIICEFGSKFTTNSDLFSFILTLSDRVASYKPTSAVIEQMEGKRKNLIKEDLKNARKKQEELDLKLREQKEKEFEQSLLSLPADVAAKKREEFKRIKKQREERKRSGRSGMQRIVVG